MVKISSYNLEIEKITKEVKENNFKKVVLQFPDGLKYYGKEIIDYLKKNTLDYDCEFFIYFGTCYGACDIPLHLKEINFDLCVQFGHNIYVKKKDMW